MESLGKEVSLGSPRNTVTPRLPGMAATMRRWIIEQSFAAHVGHIGSALSIVEITAALWGAVMRRPGTRAPDRDRFILAKGHASLALYAALRWIGRLDEETFQTYCQDGSLLGVHPEHVLPGVDVSTGSLGQGLSVGCGLAYGLRCQGSPARVFAVLSDAECNEGQVWEAAMFAAHHRLANLVAVVDRNGTQALGPTAQILDLDPLAARWAAFGWDAVEVDGHGLDDLVAVLNAPPSYRPRLVVARTVMGKGVSFMEGSTAWHYHCLSPEQKDMALAELEAAR
jgi:transketolase